MKKQALHIFFVLLSWMSFAQQDTIHAPIEIIHADNMILHEAYPDLKLLTGHVQLKHKDAILISDKVLLDLKKNFAEAIGNVLLNQGDTLSLRADVVRYDGNLEFALALGNVFLKDPTMQLNTDTLYYDKSKKLAYYESGGKIRDTVNIIESKIGKYYTDKNKYEFIGQVKIINPDYTIFSAHLDYQTDVQTSRFYGPTEIRSNGDLIYAEKGFYDSHNQTGWFKENAYVEDEKGRWMAGDSIHFTQKDSVYSASGNVRMVDSIRKVTVWAGFARQWKKKDSVELHQDPVVINYDVKDTVLFNAQNIYLKQIDTFRIVYAFPQVRFYSGEMSGKADSLYRNEKKQWIELYKNPVLWNEDSQITGDTILIKTVENNRADSLIIPSNVFIAQKDSSGFNQIKGRKLKGKFVDGKLRIINITGNAQTIYFIRDDDGKLVGIDQSVCSEIKIELNEKGEAEKIYLLEKPEGTTYPPSQYPPDKRKLKGFLWRGDEQIKSKEVILKGRAIIPQKPGRKKIITEEKQIEPPKIPMRLIKGL